MTEEQEKISEMQFDLFWMSLKTNAGGLCVMTADQLKTWSKTVWDKSREMFQSENGKKGGKAKGDCKRRPREQCQAAVKKRWDNAKKKDTDTK